MCNLRCSKRCAVITYQQIQNDKTVINNLEEVVCHSISLEAVWRITKKEISGPQTRFRQSMYLPNKKQSANHYGVLESTAEHSSSDDEVL